MIDLADYDSSGEERPPVGNGGVQHWKAGVCPTCNLVNGSTGRLNKSREDFSSTAFQCGRCPSSREPKASPSCSARVSGISSVASLDEDDQHQGTEELRKDRPEVTESLFKEREGASEVPSNSRADSSPTEDEGCFSTNEADSDKEAAPGTGQLGDT